MKFSLLIKYLDGTTDTVEARAADIVAFESHFDMSMAALEKNMRITHMLYIAWHVCKRTGLDKDQNSEKWLERVDLVEATDAKK